MNGRCRPNPFHRYLAITAFVFNLNFINLAKDWHYHFALWAFVINDWHNSPFVLLREMVGIEPTEGASPRQRKPAISFPANDIETGRFSLFLLCA
jgi:hypothetical protein